ncbi:hypothetical protein HMPREF9349_03753 [Escherichia coli MS 79-10]|nr:hypothetical protein HMPREF9349_03753 [Escherichia coli MS 79-10]
MEKSNTQYVKNEATDSLGRSRGGAILQNCAFHYQSGVSPDMNCNYCKLRN